MVVSNPASQQEKRKAGKRKREKTAKQEKKCPSSGKHRKANLVSEPQMQPVILVLQPGAATSSTQISSGVVSQQTRNEVVTATPLQSEYLRNNTAELGGSPQQTLPTSMVQNIPLQQGHLVSQQPSSKQITGITVSQQTRSDVVTTTPVQSEYLRNNTAELGGSLQQTLPTSVVQNIPLQQGHLLSQQPSSKQITGITVSQQTRSEVVSTTPVQSVYSRNNTAELGGSPQHTLPTSMVQNIPLQQGHLISQQPSSKQITGITASQQTRSEVVTTTPVQSEYSRNNTAELGGSLQQTLPTSVVQNIPLQQGHLLLQQPSSKQITGITVSQQTRSEVISTTPVQFEYSRNNTAELGGSLQQTLPTSVVQNIPLQQGHLVSQQPSSKQISGIMIAAQGSSQQYCLPAPVAMQKENCKPPLQRGQMEKQSCLSRSVLVASMQGSSQPCLPLQLFAVPGKQGQLELLINYCIEKLETLFKCQTM